MRMMRTFRNLMTAALVAGLTLHAQGNSGKGDAPLPPLYVLTVGEHGVVPSAFTVREGDVHLVIVSKARLRGGALILEKRPTPGSGLTSTTRVKEQELKVHQKKDGLSLTLTPGVFDLRFSSVPGLTSTITVVAK